MTQWEYKVVPTPRRPKKAKGVKGNPDRFAFALTESINEVAAEGWEFVKTETLPMEAKPGLLKSRVEIFQSLMVFRRALPGFEAAEGDVPPMPPGIIVSQGEAQLTAERYVEPTAENQSGISAEVEAEPAVANPEPAPQPKDELSFDADNLDPLKKVVEANRSST